MRIAYGTPAEAARALEAVWKSSGVDARAQPFDFHRSEETPVWFVVESKEWPAFPYSKVVVSARPHLVPAGHLFVGFCSEKGLEGAGAAAARSPDWVMDGTWRWHDVVRTLIDGSFGTAIAGAAKNVGEPLRIITESHAGGLAPGELRDVLSWSTEDGSSLEELHPPSLRTIEQYLAGLVDARTLSELGEALRKIPRGEWAWVNFYVGLDLESSNAGDRSALDGRQIWDRLLLPFSPWLEQ